MKHPATTVALQVDGQLTLKPDYQPLYHLRPYQGGIFSIVELEGFRVEFRRGYTSSTDELVFSSAERHVRCSTECVR